MERRLSAILAADMVGSSRLMEADETGTLERQKRHHSELIDPRIEAHHGRIIKLTGDGLIAEFPSVVEAVQCAVSVQREMETREADVPEEQRIRYRIAVNLGDVIVDDDEVYGNGMIVAARLEALAEPGGVVTSLHTVNLVQDKINAQFTRIGSLPLKKSVRTGQFASPHHLASNHNKSLSKHFHVIPSVCIPPFQHHYHKKLPTQTNNKQPYTHKHTKIQTHKHTGGERMSSRGDTSWLDDPAPKRREPRGGRRRRRRGDDEDDDEDGEGSGEPCAAAVFAPGALHRRLRSLRTWA